MNFAAYLIILVYAETFVFTGYQPLQRSADKLKVWECDVRFHKAMDTPVSVESVLKQHASA